LSVRHTSLQNAQLDEASAAGAKVMRPASVSEIQWSDNRPEVRVAADSGVSLIRPRLLVGADGVRSLTRRFLGGIAITDLPHHAIGGALLTGIDVPDNSAHQAFFDGGFAMIFPQQDHSSRVYYVCSSETAHSMQRDHQPENLIVHLSRAMPDGALAHAAAAGPTAFFPNSETRSSVTYGSATLLLGDAAGSNDPTQGHGLSLVYRDIRDLTERLVTTHNWQSVPRAFAQDRARDHEVLRTHAQWVAPLSVNSGIEAERLREQVALAREEDPTGGGFAAIFATGPAGLKADEHARRHFLGEDLRTAQVR
jgi:2-polyprenyl-6-methoxyphenol hydroxylase-like FAD-dependent oxidoreductase